MEVECDVTEIPTLNTTMFNDMLHFEDFEEFETIIEAMDFQCSKAITEWAAGFSGFESLKIFHDSYLENNPTVDKWEYWAESRIKDMQIEAILNEDRKVRIADTVFETSADLQTGYKYLVDGEDVEHEAFSIFGIFSGHGCSTGHKYNYAPLKVEVGPNWCQNFHSQAYNCKVAANKYVTRSIFGSKLAIKIVYWKSNGIQDFDADFPSSLSAPYLASFIDEYHQLSYYTPHNGGSPSNPNIISNHLYLGLTGSTDVEFRIERQNLRRAICVIDFERTHNWAGDDKFDLWSDILSGNLGTNLHFNQDAHHDHW